MWSDIIYIPKHQLTFLFTLKVIKLFGVKIFTTIEGNINDFSKKNMISNFGSKNKFIRYFRNFDGVFPITKFIYENKKIDFNLQKKVLRLGVSEVFFKQKFQTKSSINIIFIGNLVSAKGIDELIKFSLTFHDVNFHIVGEGFLKSKVVSSCLKNVKVYGKLSRDELSELIIKMDLNISFSKSEGFSKTILETASSGVPSLIYNLFDTDEYLVNENNCFLANNYDDFITILNKFRANEFDLKYISNNAIKLAEKNKWNVIIKDWQDVIDKFLCT